MYNFPNFDNDTCFIMVSELVRDMKVIKMFKIKN